MQFKRTKYLLIIGLLFNLVTLHAQYFEFGYVNNVHYSNYKDGFFSQYINTNSTSLYVLNANYTMNSLTQFQKLKLICYDKNTMMEKTSVELIGYPGNAGVKEQYEGLKYATTVVFEDNIIVFWKKRIFTDSSTTEEVYADVFETDLMRSGKLKLVFKQTQCVDFRESDFSPSNTIIAPAVGLDMLVIGGEQLVNRSYKFDYVLLNSSLGVEQKSNCLLPERTARGTNGLTSSYELGKDGNIYIRSLIHRTKEERIDLGKKAGKTFLMLTVLNPVLKKSSTISFDYLNKTITDFNFITTSAGARIIGFFGDLEKDPSGIDKQGVFYKEIPKDSLNGGELKFIYFERTSLNKLFPKSKGGRPRKGDPVKQLTEEELNTRFDIEYMEITADNSIILFFTRKYNYEEKGSSSDLNGENVYHTDYYCEKNNVSAIRLTAEGTINWTSNMERSVTYLGTDVSDLKVLKLSGKYYVFYGTENETENAGKKKKSKDLYVKQVEYAVFNPGSSKPKKNELNVDPDQVDLKHLSILNPKTFVVFENKIYFNKISIRQKPLWYAANVVCFPTIFYSVLSGNTKQGKALLGVISLLDGKEMKKRSGRK